MRQYAGMPMKMQFHAPDDRETQSPEASGSKGAKRVSMKGLLSSSKKLKTLNSKLETLFICGDVQVQVPDVQ